MSITAKWGQGKTHFLCTAPDPLAIQSLNIGLKGVVEKFPDKRIYYKSYRIAITLKRIATTISRKANEQADRSPLSIDVDTVIDEWEGFKKDYFTLLDSKDIRTIGWDTGTEVWQQIRAARFGKLDQVETHLYGPVNMEMDYLIKCAFDSGKNLIILHEVKDEYKERALDNGKKMSVRTGGYIRDGYSKMDHRVEVCAHMNFDKSNKVFSITLDKCRLNPDLVGETFSGEMCNFPTIASLIYPTVDLEAWR